MAQTSAEPISYMRLRGMLEVIRPESVLALTATAGPQVIDDVCRTLGIPEGRAPDFEDVSLSESDNAVSRDDHRRWGHQT